ncbi:hypothetical protein L218DRAFT_985249 [Marasmius fiardii PR-910]|nr:hypothetical protein L218DRAFT_985249 [Marasmius fiardii PR-910]
MTPIRLFLLSVLNILGLALQAGAVANRTIDDSSTDFTFTGAWSVNSCPNCGSQPDSGQAHNGTWHASNNQLATARLDFTGSAIWVYGILAPASNQGSINITLDGKSSVYNSSGNTNSSFTYNELLFNASSLSAFSHTLTFKSIAGDDSGHSVLIDYVVVSDFATSPSSADKAANLKFVKIIAPIVGTLVGLCIIGCIIRRFRRRKPQAFTVYEETTVMVPVTGVRPVTVWR